MDSATIFSNKKDLHKVLGVEKGCTEGEVKRAYRRLALRFHPDKYEKGVTPHSEADHLEAFRIICRAQEILLDDGKRRIYELGGMDDVDKYESRGDAAIPTVKEAIQMVSFVCLVFMTREGFRNVRRAGNPHPDGDVPLGDAEARRRSRSTIREEKQVYYAQIRHVFRILQLALLFAVAASLANSARAFVVSRCRHADGAFGCVSNVIFRSHAERSKRSESIRKIARTVGYSGVIPTAPTVCDLSVPPEEHNIYLFEQSRWMLSSSDSFDAKRLRSSSRSFTRLGAFAAGNENNSVSLLPVPLCGYTEGPYYNKDAIPFYSAKALTASQSRDVDIASDHVHWVGTSYCDAFELPIASASQQRASEEQFGRRWESVKRVCRDEECKRLSRRPIRLRRIAPSVQSDDQQFQQSPICVWWASHQQKQTARL